MMQRPEINEVVRALSDTGVDMEVFAADLFEALVDIAMTNIPSVPRGVTVQPAQYAEFAMERARAALGSHFVRGTSS